MVTAKEVIVIANKEVGYEEKKSANGINEKHTNAGSNNFTKYEKEVFGSNGNYWCASFVSWCFWSACKKDKKKATSILGTLSMSCEVIRQKFIKNDRYSKTPKVGDAIFFSGTRHAGANHIGIVTKVTSKEVHTVEGNTSSKEFDDNGGCVAKHVYSRTSTRILGYGHPKYDEEKSVVKKTTSKAATAKTTTKKTTSNTTTAKTTTKKTTSKATTKKPVTKTTTKKTTTKK